MRKFIDLSVLITKKAKLRRMPEVQYLDHEEYAKSRGPQLGLASGSYGSGDFLQWIRSR